MWHSQTLQTLLFFHRGVEGRYMLGTLETLRLAVHQDGVVEVIEGALPGQSESQLHVAFYL